MPITNSQIIEDAPQADGRRYVRYLYTFSEGFERVKGPKLVPAAFDADADLAALVPIVEAREKRRELHGAEARIISGELVADMLASLQFNTDDEVLAYLLKRMSNLFRALTHNILTRDLADLIFLKPVVDSLPPAQIATLLGVSVPDVATWRAALTLLENGVNLYSHTLPEFEDV